MGISDNLQLSIHDFRAIKKADISLNGITVLAGVNGCGKSTISKLFYVLIRRMKNYNELVLHEVSPFIRRYTGVLENLLISYTHDYSTYLEYSEYFQLKKWEDLIELDARVTALCDLILEQKQKKNELRGNDDDRNRRMLINTIDGAESLSFEEALRSLQELIHIQVSNAQENSRQRSISFLNNYLDRAFGEKINKKVTLTEYGNTIFSEKRTTVPVPHFVDQLFYIDTPFALDNNYYEYWDDLNRVLKQPDRLTDSPIASVIGKQILKGDAKYEKTENRSGFYFKDNKGNIFNLLVTATGIRSFSIIQMLLRSGNINENTLLILDEPEAHLHPQWIVEYARIIAHIHKMTGAKFLISSHSPDMVSAIRDIAEAENCTSILEFYEARRAQDGSGRFIFKSTGLNIDPIFKSFNKSYYYLQKYAGK